MKASKNTNKLMLRLLCTLLTISGYFNCIQAQLVINEISICNVNKELDPKYDYRGWIELFNNSENNIDLKDLFFSDEENNPKKYNLTSSRVIPAKSYAAVWLNDELIDKTTGYYLDTDADDGGYLSVSGKDGHMYDALTYPAQYTNVSYGRSTDGDPASPLVYFIESTFCKSNNGAKSGEEMVSTPIISEASGFYDNTFTVKISCKTADAEIYYTTDASEPTKKSNLYTMPITIDKTTTLRARAFKEGCFDGLIATNTYMVNERKPQNLPIVFLTSSPENLYDDMLGIYCEGKNGIQLTASSPVANYNCDWTRWSHIEIQDEQRDLYFSHPIGLAISGNASRKFAQKSFKIKGKSRFGHKRFDYPLFPTRNGMRYKSFLLRSGGQFYNTIQLIHDACIQSLADITPLDYQASTPAVVYLNGDYWGIYNLRERKNKDMVYSHYGLSETDFNMIEYSWRALPSNGSTDSWKKLEDFMSATDFTNEKNYEQARQMIDIDNFLYYMAIELLIYNNDWPNNNQHIFRPHGEGSRWEWVLQDLDKGLEGNPKNKLKELMESSSTLLSTKLIVYLLANEKFKDQYITIQSLVAGSVFAPERYAERLSTMRNAIAAEYPYYQSKWPEQGKNELEKTTKNMINNEEKASKQTFEFLKENFSLGEIHSLVITSSQPDANLTFNDTKIPVLPYSGSWFEGKELVLQAPLYNGDKKFITWEITAGGETKTIATTTINLPVEKDTQVKAVYDKAEYIRRPGLYINEISADNSTYVDEKYKYEDWIELYNSSDYPINLSGYYLSIQKEAPDQFQFPENDQNEMIVPARGYTIIWCSKKTDRGVLHTNFKLGKEGGSIYLSQNNEDGQIELVDSVNYKGHDSTVSFGRYPDGCETLSTFYVPTFKAANFYSSYDIFGYTEEYELVTGIETEVKQEGDAPILQKTDNNQLYINHLPGSSIRVISVNGTTFLNEMLNQNESYIDMNNYPQGLYLIIIESGSERWIFKSIR